ncbi:MAG: Protease 4 [Firmicutes bacterium]|nr:Protease 4 [Bacillota bacterium]MBT9158578.1 Protease 4 [Bacillota bacterium]
MSTIVWLLKGLMTFIRNLCRGRRRAPEYVHLIISGSLPDLSEPRRNFWQKYLSQKPLSLEELSERFERIARHRQIRGVVLHLGDFDLPQAKVQALQGEIAALRQRGKRVVTWATNYKRCAYQVALLADQVLLQEGGSIGVLGLATSQTYWKDSLARVGLGLDAVAISPYKSAADRLTQEKMSDEVRAMNDWLLDSHYAELTKDLCQGRGVAKAKAEEIIDHAPYTSARAMTLGLIDGIVSEEDLPEHLGQNGRLATLSPWSRAEKVLPLLPLPNSSGYFGVIRVTGNIVDGISDRPPFKLPIPIPYLFAERSGDTTVVAQARAALLNNKVKGLLLYVDSGGGSAAASEAMYAALAKVATKKPVVAMMGAKAASGGYYVTAAAHHVVARPGSITGSIGVLAGKLLDEGLVKNLLANRFTQSRGESAELELPSRPYTAGERQVKWEQISALYELFLRRVAKARRTTPEAIEQKAGGRVWTGRQALEHGLLDSLGGRKEAVAKLQELTGLSGHVALRDIPLGRAEAPPLAPSAALVYGLESVRLFNEAHAQYICLYDEQH